MESIYFELHNIKKEDLRDQAKKERRSVTTIINLALESYLKEHRGNK